MFFIHCVLMQFYLLKKKKKNEIIPAESTRTHTLIFSKTINWLTALFFYLRKSDMAQYFWKDFYTRSLNLIWSLKQCEDRSPLLIVTIS